MKRHRPALLQPKWQLLEAGLLVILVVACGFLYRQSQLAATNQSPAASTKLDPVKQAFASMTLEQKIASLLMLHVEGLNPEAFQEFMEHYQPGGLILMGDNVSPDISSVKKISDTIQASASPFAAFIAIDEEGCAVKRLPQDTFPCAAELGQMPVNQTEQAFQQRSKLLQHAGINLNFGIVADVTADPSSFIYPRVFGSDPLKVGRYVSAAIRGSQDTVWTTIKHFPGHGSTAADSHSTLPRVTETKQEWQRRDAIPFAAGIKARVKGIMFSHLVYEQIDAEPASLSQAWHNILFQELNFHGIMITDDLLMLQQSGEPPYQDLTANAVAAIKAGNHLTLIVNNNNPANAPHTVIEIDRLIQGIAQAVHEGRLDEALINKLALKNLQWRATLTN